jgi:hypothetical protein
MSRSLARWLHGFVALVATVGTCLRLAVPMVEGPDIAATTAGDVAHVLSYFTIQSNILVAVTSALLALRPARSGPVFRVLRLDALLCISISAIVYHVVLDHSQPTPLRMVANLLLHTAVPIGALVAWLLVGPRPLLSWTVIAWALVPPLGWAAYTFVRGAVIAWYPYPFLDVTKIGLGRALADTGAVAVLFLALGGLARLVERFLAPAPTQPRPRAGGHSGAGTGGVVTAGGPWGRGSRSRPHSAPGSGSVTESTAPPRSPAQGRATPGPGGRSRSSRQRSARRT